MAKSTKITNFFGTVNNKCNSSVDKREPKGMEWRPVTFSQEKEKNCKTRLSCIKLIKSDRK